MSRFKSSNQKSLWSSGSECTATWGLKRFEAWPALQNCPRRQKWRGQRSCWEAVRKQRPSKIGYRCLKNEVPSGYVKIASENGHLYWVFPLKMVIFHSYVSLPEGTPKSSKIQKFYHQLCHSMNPNVDKCWVGCCTRLHPNHPSPDNQTWQGGKSLIIDVLMGHCHVWLPEGIYIFLKIVFPPVLPVSSELIGNSLARLLR